MKVTSLSHSIIIVFFWAAICSPIFASNQNSLSDRPGNKANQNYNQVGITNPDGDALNAESLKNKSRARNFYFIDQLFSTEIPDTWTNTDDSGEDVVWEIQSRTWGAFTGAAVIDSEPYPGQNVAATLTSPYVDVTSADQLLLSYVHSFIFDGIETAKVEVFNGVEWITIKNYTGDNNAWGTEE